MITELSEGSEVKNVGVMVHLQMEQRCWQRSQRNAGTWDGMVDRNEVQSMEYRVWRWRRETGGLGFNLCVAFLPKNKGVFNLDKQRRQVGCIFAKVNNNYKLGSRYKSGRTLYYRTQSNMANGVV